MADRCGSTVAPNRAGPIWSCDGVVIDEVASIIGPVFVCRQHTREAIADRMRKLDEAANGRMAWPVPRNGG